MPDASRLAVSLLSRRCRIDAILRSGEENFDIGTSRPGPVSSLVRNRHIRIWQYALVGAAAAVPLMSLGYWQSGSELPLSPVLLGGVLAGYLAVRETGSRPGVGLRVGLLAGLAGLWVLRDMVWAPRALAGPDWFVVACLAFVALAAVCIAALVVPFSILLGAGGTKVGG